MNHESGSYSGGSALADLDHDGDLDIILATYFTYYSEPDYVLFNNGAGVFTNEYYGLPNSSEESSSEVLVFDIDNDTYEDIIITPNHSKGAVQIFKNDSNGNGYFTLSSVFIDGDVFFDGVAFDIDGDEDKDIISSIGTRYEGQTFLNNGQGSFQNKTNDLVPSMLYYMRFVVSGDIDNDMDFDFLIANGDLEGGNEWYWVNQGGGSFKDESAKINNQPDDMTFNIALGDIDQDNDLDYVVGQYQQDSKINQIEIYKNNEGQFTISQAFKNWPNDDTANFMPAVSDVNNDGYPDIVVGADDFQSRLLMNNGTGYFVDETSSRIPTGNYSTESIICRDFNGDGYSDIILINNSASQFCRFYSNQGNGYFEDLTNTVIPRYARYFKHASADDFDGDGDLDLAIAEFYGYHRLWINDINTSGKFTDMSSSLPAGLIGGYKIASGDVNGDGDNDIIIGQEDDGNSDYSMLLYNDGEANFTLASDLQFPKEKLEQPFPVLSDVDSDGDLDIFTTNLNSYARLFIQE